MSILFSQWDALKQRVQHCHEKRTRLSLIYQQLQELHQDYLQQSTQAHNRLNANDYVKEILDDLQHKEHQRSVGTYEKLLSSFLSEVLPGERDVVLDLHTDRGASALDIFIRKGENAPLEDVWLGSGGSVKNLLSTGLRLIALLRSGQRRFLVLDESDCWIQPALIPKYAQIVQQMSQELNIQILMISHHKESLFASVLPHRLQLQKLNSGLLTAEWSPTSNLPVWTEDQIGLRSIHLKNFQSHQNTFIPLSPYITLLQGDNDIGKSSIVSSLKAVFEGSSNDTLIKHYTTSCSVELDFGPEHLLTWTRFLKGKIKCSYQLLDVQHQTVLHASDGTKVPDWVTQSFKLGKIDGFDVQIGQQQEPVFLLNQPSSVKAKALSIGQESDYITIMMSLDKQEIQEAKNTLKLCEKKLELIRRKMTSFSSFPERKDTLEHLYVQHIQHSQYCQQNSHLLKKWQTLIQKQHILHTSFADLILPKAQSLHLSTFLNTWKKISQYVSLFQKLSFQKIDMPLFSSPQQSILLYTWQTCIRKQHILQYNSSHLVLPVLTFPNYHSLLHKWQHYQQKQAILQSFYSKPLDLPLFKSYLPSSLYHNWKQLEQNSLDNTKGIEQCTHNEHQLIEKLHKNYSVCPLCQRSFD